MEEGAQLINHPLWHIFPSSPSECNMTRLRWKSNCRTLQDNFDIMQLWKLNNSTVTLWDIWPYSSVLSSNVRLAFWNLGFLLSISSFIGAFPGTCAAAWLLNFEAFSHVARVCPTCILAPTHTLSLTNYCFFCEHNTQFHSQAMFSPGLFQLADKQSSLLGTLRHSI